MGCATNYWVYELGTIGLCREPNIRLPDSFVDYVEVNTHEEGLLLELFDGGTG
jgi:hypothetical protein